jgi:hypothetical protein
MKISAGGKLTRKIAIKRKAAWLELKVKIKFSTLSQVVN